MINALEILDHIQQYAYQKNQYQDPPVFSQPVHSLILLWGNRQATSCSMIR